MQTKIREQNAAMDDSSTGSSVPAASSPTAITHTNTIEVKLKLQVSLYYCLSTILNGFFHFALEFFGAKESECNHHRIYDQGTSLYDSPTANIRFEKRVGLFAAQIR